MSTSNLDIIIVGAGFAGLGALHSLRTAGFNARVVEAGSGVGGTWYWNRYPGARCDCDSMEYSFSFSPEMEQEWTWSERYATQPEILAYLNFVAEKFNLLKDIDFDRRVERMTFDEDAAVWNLYTDTGTSYRAQHCIMATGALSVPKDVEVEGLGDFKGEVLHTGRWPHDGVDFSGKTVAVIGTGSSGVQAIPIIAEQAEKTYVLQRSPNFVIPARNRPLTEEEVSSVKARYREVRKRAVETPSGHGLWAYGTSSVFAEDSAARAAAFDRAWQRGGAEILVTYSDILSDAEANSVLADYVRAKIQETVQDPETTASMMPLDHPIGTKRPCIGTDYYETFNRDDVELIDLRKDPLERISSDGVQLRSRHLEVDSLVMASGFDALTGALNRIDIRGRSGLELRKHWENGPQTYLGLGVSGFPNLFLVAGAGSPSVLGNVIVSIEQHVAWIVKCLSYLREEGHQTIEADRTAEADWVAHVNEVASSKLIIKATTAWYQGANVPGKPRVFMPYAGGIPAYRARIEAVAANKYEGFILAPPAPTPSGSPTVSSGRGGYVPVGTGQVGL